MQDRKRRSGKWNWNAALIINFYASNNDLNSDPLACKNQPLKDLSIDNII